MSYYGPPPPPPRRPLWNIFRNLCTAVTVVFGLTFGTSQIPALNRAICASNASAQHQRLSALVCDADRLALTDTQATELVDSFTAALFGSHRAGSAWQVLNGPSSERVPGEFQAAWDPVVFARRTSPVTHDPGINNFRATVERFRYSSDWMSRERDFYADPDVDVDTVDLSFEITLTDRGVSHASMPLIRNRHPIGRPPQGVLHAEVPTDFFGLPDRSTDKTPEMHPIGRGATAYAVCDEETDGTPQWWSMTYLGWVPNEDYGVGDAPVEGVRLCPQLP